MATENLTGQVASATALSHGTFLFSKVLMPFLAVVGQTFPFWPQIAIIRRGEAEGFSIMISLVVLVSAIFRCFFWLGKRFQTVLLIQSLVMIALQFVLLKVWTTRPRKKTDDRFNKSLVTSGWDAFWDWDDFMSYAMTIGIFLFGVSTLHYFLGENTQFIEALGFLALGVEALMLTPQLVKNQKNRDTTGFTVWTIATITIGDVGKTVWFIMESQPAQFWVCGTLQCSVDVLIIIQMLVFNGPWGGTQKRKDSKDGRPSEKVALKKVKSPKASKRQAKTS